MYDYCRDIPGVIFNKSELSVAIGSAKIYLSGADNPDALRGIWLDSVVLDEYAQMAPRMFTEIIRPALADRQGRALFIGTPQGKNAFYALYNRAEELEGWWRDYLPVTETDCLDKRELMAARREMSAAEYDQEFLLSWSAAIQGAFFGHEMKAAEDEGRITKVPYDKSLPVDLSFDLGMANRTVVWYMQTVGAEIRAIRCDAFEATGLPDIIAAIRSRGYSYIRERIAPHDIRVRELGTGQSRFEIAQKLGFDFTVCRNIPVIDGIEAVRSMIPRVWFDAELCKDGIEALTQYRTEKDPIRNVFRTTPLHDWTSDYADSLRMYAVEMGAGQSSFEWGRTKIDYREQNRAVI